MKEFRVARCIDDRGDVPVIKKYAIFKDGSRRLPIETDDKGREYISVDNWIQSEPEMDEFNHGELNNYLKYSFSGKPKDAIDSIRKGYGDVLSVIRVFGKIERVLYFLDRDYGEPLRQQTLNGWKDTKYGYVLYFDSIALNRNNGTRDFEREDIFFNSSGDAIKFAERMVANSVTLADKIHGYPYKKDAPYLSFMDEIENPVVDLVFKQFEDIYNEGDVFKRKDGVTSKTLLRSFSIKQEPISK